MGDIVFLSFLCSLGWSISSVFVKIGIKNTNSIEVNTIRLYSSLFLWTIISIFRKEVFLNEFAIIDKNILVLLFFSAFFGLILSGNFSMLAIKLIGVSKTTTIFHTYSFWVLLFARLFLNRVVTKNMIMGTMLLVLSVLIIYNCEIKDIKTSKIFKKGIFLVLLASICEGLSIIINDYLSYFYFSPTALSGFRVLTGCFIITVLFFKRIKKLKHFSKKEIIFSSLAGFFGTFFAQFMGIKAISIGGSQVVAPILSITPLLSSILSFIFLKEKFSKNIIIAVIISTIGILLIRL